MFIGDDPDERWMVQKRPDPLAPKAPSIFEARFEPQGCSLLCSTWEEAKEVAEFLNSRKIAPLVDLDE